MKKKKLKKRGTSRKTWRNKCDKKWSEKVKERADYQCEFCKTDRYLNAHHIYSRSNLTMRYNLDNGVCLCSGHHTLSSMFSAHKTPLEFLEWIKSKRGDKWYDSIRETSRIISKHIDYEQMGS